MKRKYPRSQPYGDQSDQSNLATHVFAHTLSAGELTNGKAGHRGGMQLSVDSPKA